MQHGLDLLARTLGVVDIMGSKRWDEDAQVQDDLDSFALCDTAQVYSPQTIRARVRYLAALFPNMAVADLPRAVHTLLGGDLRAPDLSDIRFMLNGQSLRNGSSTGEPPIAKLQMAGSMLSRGETYIATAEATGLSYGMVRDIDVYLGLTTVYEQRLIEQAVYARQDKLSVRQFAERAGLSRSTAHRILTGVWTKAGNVIDELGGGA